MSNASNLLLVFSCSAIIKVENSPEYCLNAEKCCAGDSLWGNRWQSSDPRNTVGCFVPWCNVSHCLIWHSAATQLFGFVTFYGPSAPVPPIVPEFSIFGKKLDSLNWCVGQYNEKWTVYSPALYLCFFFTPVVAQLFKKTILENMIHLGRTMKHFSPGHLNVMLSLACYWHVA